MATDIPAVIRQCSFFTRLDAQAVGLLADLAVLRRFARGQTIIRPEQNPPGMFIVAEGQVRIYTLAATGKEHVLHLAGPNQTFLEVAVMGDFKSPAFCEAIEDTTAVMLPSAEFRRALQSNHPLCLQILASMSFWVRHLVGLLEDIVLRDAAGRVARYLLTEAERQGGTIELPSLKKHLASHLNLTSETLSRTLRRLSDAGLIGSGSDAGGSSQAIRILDAAGLEEAAEGAFPRL